MDYIFRILPNMFSGLGVSAQIFIFTIVLSLPLGMLLAMVRISKVGLFRPVTKTTNGRQKNRQDSQVFESEQLRRPGSPVLLAHHEFQTGPHV